MNLYSILALPILMLYVEKVESQSHGDLRLIQQGIKNSSFTAGRLEIFLNSIWGSICADNFDIIAADVACRQLGYFAALKVETSFHTPYGRGVDGPVWLDEVSCNDADLLHILSCSHVGLEENDCNHFSDVAVTCMEQVRWAHPNDMDVRLVGGNFKSQGMLEVNCNKTWAPVCPLQGSQFGKAEGDAVCRQLGYTESIRLWTLSSDFVEEMPVYSNKLECPEGAKSIASCGGSCGLSEGASEGNFAMSQTSCVFIECTHSVSFGSLRLSQGSHVTPGALEGRLEIFYDGKWDTVCSRGFDLVAANISCKQLGFMEAMNYTESIEVGFGEGATGSASLGGIHCTSEDDKVIQCATNREQRNCTHLEDVAVFCTNFSFVEPPTSDLDKHKYVFPLEIFIPAMIGSCLFFIMFSICLVVYKLHFSLVSYDTMKEQSSHGLYFTEYEGSSFTLDEKSLDQKLPESTTAKEGKSKRKDIGKSDAELSEQQPQRKKKIYITKKTKLSSPTSPSVPQPAVNNDHSESSLPPHAQNSLLPSSKSSSYTNSALPFILSPLMVKKKNKQEKAYSKKDPASKYSRKAVTSPQLTTDKPTHVQPEVGDRTGQGSCRISKSSGSDQRLPPPKPEPYNGIRRQMNQPETQASETSDGVKGLPLVKPTPYRDLRKGTSHPETQASEGVNNFDNVLLRVTPKDQHPTLDVTGAHNSSAGIPIIYTKHDNTHRVSFKFE